MQNIIKKIKKDELKKILKNIKKFNQIFDYLKIAKNSKNTKLIRSKIIEYGLEDSANHLKWKIKPKSLLSDTNQFHCFDCNFYGLWNDKPLQLKEFKQLNKDNILESIYRCPNCISQMKFKPISKSTIDKNKSTDSDSIVKEKNQKTCQNCSKIMIKVAKTGLCKDCLSVENTNKNLKEISKEDLEKMFWDLPSTQIAELFEISDTYLSRYAKKLGINKPSRGYWTGRR